MIAAMSRFAKAKVLFRVCCLAQICPLISSNDGTHKSTQIQLKIQAQIQLQIDMKNQIQRKIQISCLFSGTDLPFNMIQ